MKNWLKMWLLQDHFNAALFQDLMTELAARLLCNPY